MADREVIWKDIFAQLLWVASNVVIVAFLAFHLHTSVIPSILILLVQCVAQFIKTSFHLH